MSMEKKELKDWGEKEIDDFLKEEKLEKWKKQIKENKLTGVDLQNLDRLEKIGIKNRGDRLTISNAVTKFLGKKSPGKVLNDPIHGLMALHPLLIKIMDTPQFQRLRHIKQLGGAYFVYPGASHNRFEHSVGVAHLAGELAKALASKQPELKIDDRDILCVQIAGLCHDLGHGPFSHLYDGIFIPKACGETQWKHEDASLRMFDHLVKDNGLKPLMELHSLKPEENDLMFIREMIQGKPLTEAQDKTSWPYKGRTEEKSFLYEIVANKLNGIDVDKFDYLARDTYHLGMQSNFDHKRFIMLARVCEVYNKETKKYEKHICSRDKEVGNLYDMFHTRYCLHRRVCQHKTHKSIEIMISDAFLKADEHIMIEGSDGKMFTLSTAKDDMKAYTKLTDRVFETILHPSSELEKVGNILQCFLSSSSELKEVVTILPRLSELKEAVKILYPNLSPSELEKVSNILHPLLSPSSELEEAIKILHPLLSSSSSELEEAIKILHPLLSPSSKLEEAVKILDPFLSSPSSELKEAIKILHRLSELEENVNIVYHFLFSPSELEEARKILERIVSRDLYKFVDEAKECSKPKQGQEATSEKIEDLKAKDAKDENPAGSVEVTSTEKGKPNMSKTLQEKIEELKGELAKENQANDFEVPIVTFDYGKNEEDPINHTFFYSKNDNTRGFKISKEQKSKLIPETFSEKIVRVYCKNPNNVDLHNVREVFKVWCMKNDFTVPEDEELAVPPKKKKSEAEDMVDDEDGDRN